MNTRERVLKEALNCVNGERENQYGNPEDNFKRIADLWSVYLTSLFEDEKIVVEIDPIDVAKMMILFKIARSNGDKDKLDNYVDMIGYAACGAEIFENYKHDELVKNIKDEFLKRLHTAISVKDSKKVKEWINKVESIPNVQVAEECKECDYAEKCMGTGVCLKEKRFKLVLDTKKDKPDEKCNEIASEISRVIETAKHLKGYKYDSMSLNDDELLTVIWKKLKENHECDN